MRRPPPDEKGQLALEVGRAIRRARSASKLSAQQALADVLGVEQTTVSKWERGEVLAELPQIMAVERALGLERGTILVLAGLVTLAPGQTERSLLSDPNLTDESRAALLTFYRAAARLAGLQPRAAPRPHGPASSRRPGCPPTGSRKG